MKKIRLFIALDLPQKIKTELNHAQKELARNDLEIRWVKPKNFHLTLVFLGWTESKNAKSIESILKEVSGQIRPIQLKFTKINAFPKMTRARVIFIDLGGELAKLNTLSLKIRNELAKKEFKFDQKPLVAHLTLGRLKNPRSIVGKLGKAKIQKIELELKQISLIKSQLTRSGPIYTPLKKFPLGQNY